MKLVSAIPKKYHDGSEQRDCFEVIYNFRDPIQLQRTSYDLDIAIEVDKRCPIPAPDSHKKAFSIIGFDIGLEQLEGDSLDQVLDKLGRYLLRASRAVRQRKKNTASKITLPL